MIDPQIQTIKQGNSHSLPTGRRCQLKAREFNIEDWIFELETRRGTGLNSTVTCDAHNLQFKHEDYVTTAPGGMQQVTL